MLVEDDATVRTVVRDYLGARGYDVRAFPDGLSAARALERTAPDVLVVDRMLPGLSGDEVLRRARATSDMPVVMLTAMDSVAARIDGLERGADDYVTKPFALRELHLRVDALLRRRAEARTPLVAFTVGRFRVDPAAHRVWRDGHEITLTIREHELLMFFLKNPGRTVAREEILREVWGWTTGEASTVTVHVRRLREKIEPEPREPRHLCTVWGAGYVFVPGARS